MSTNRKVKEKPGKTVPHTPIEKKDAPPPTPHGSPPFSSSFWPVDKTGATKTIIKPAANAPLLLSLRQNKRQGGIFPDQKEGVVVLWALVWVWALRPGLVLGLRFVSSHRKRHTSWQDILYLCTMCVCTPGTAIVNSSCLFLLSKRICHVR